MNLPGSLYLPTTNVRAGLVDQLDARQMKKRHDLALAFLMFHQANPHVVRRFHRLAWDYLTTVRSDVVSAVHTANVLRWETHLATRSSDFLLNNNHIAFYTRVLESNDPGLTDRITRRRSLADDMEWRTMSEADVKAMIERSLP